MEEGDMNDMMGSYSMPMFMMWLIMGIIIIFPFWFIFPKAGFSKWLSLLMIVPIVNIIMIYILAFSQWSGKRNNDE
jgi:uncharacterized protein (DUF983 family)